MNRPRRFAYALLVRWLPPGDVGASIRGDLEEEFARRPPGLTRHAWYIATALRLAMEYGFATQLREIHRMHVGTSVDAWRHDLRSALRSVVRQRRYLTSTAITLALGIGTNTAIFSILYGALWQPLPYAEPDRLMRIGDRSQSAPPTSTSSMSVPNFLDLQDAAHTIGEWAAYQYATANLSESAVGPSQALGMDITPGFFEVLGVRLNRGRALTSSDAEAGAGSVVILSDGLWRNYYGADPGIVGRSVRIDLVPHSVIGITPPEFDFPGAPQLWRPLVWPSNWLANRRWRRIEGIGRLAGGVTPEAARVELASIFARLERAHPDANDGWTTTVVPLRDWIVRGRDRDLLLFGGAVLLVLMIAAANAANLMIARAEARAHEMAVRAAMGAGRGRLLRLLAAEGIGIALIGGGAGVFAAYWGVRGLTLGFASAIPRAETIGLNPVVLAFSVGLSILVGALVGLVASRQAGGNQQLNALRSGTRTDRRDTARFRRWMIVSEVALTMVLTTGAALLTTTVWQLRQIDLGVDTNGVLTASVSLPVTSYPDSTAIVAFYGQLLDRLEIDRAVDAAGVISRQPLRGGTNGYFVASGSPDPVLTEMRQVTPHIFRALGIRLVAGRTVADPADANDGVVVNQALARVMFGEGSIDRVLGRSIQPADGNRTYEVVGVVSDLREFGPAEDPRPTAYWPLGRAPWAAPPSATIVVRGVEGGTRRLAPLLRNRLADLDASLPLAGVATLEDLAAETIGNARRAAFTLLGLFALVGLLLGALGIYSVISYAVESRTREIGIRMALGATGRRVTWLVLWDGVRLACLGVAIGMVASVASARMLGSLLYGVKPTDLTTLLGVATLLAAVATLASLTPAVRAAGKPIAHALGDR